MIVVDIASPVFPQPTWHEEWEPTFAQLKRHDDGWKFWIRRHRNGEIHVHVVPHPSSEETARLAATF